MQSKSSSQPLSQPCHCDTGHVEAGRSHAWLAFMLIAAQLCALEEGAAPIPSISTIPLPLLCPPARPSCTPPFPVAYPPFHCTMPMAFSCACWLAHTPIHTPGGVGCGHAHHLHQVAAQLAAGPARHVRHNRSEPVHHANESATASVYAVDVPCLAVTMR